MVKIGELWIFLRLGSINWKDRTKTAVLEIVKVKSRLLLKTKYML